MTSITAVSIHNNLTSSQARVTLRAANYKATGWIDEEFRLIIQILGWDNCFNYLFNHITMNLFISRFWVMLGRNNYRIHAHWLVIFIVLNGHLRLSIWSQIGNLS